MDKTKTIANLEKIKDITIESKADLNSWKAKATNLITRIYGKDSNHEKQIDQILFNSYTGYDNGIIYSNGNNSNECEKSISELIDGWVY